MKKQLITLNGFGTQQRGVTTRNIAEILIILFHSHIGQENAISKDALFEKIFMRDYNQTEIKDWLRWEFVKKAMHFCRVYTNCFIGFKRDGAEYSFFVLKSEEDAQHYIKTLDNSIRKMRFMQNKARKYVEKEEYKKGWKIDAKVKLLK